MAKTLDRKTVHSYYNQ